MIPLSPSSGIKKFPTFVFYFIGGLWFIHLGLLFLPLDKELLLAHVDFSETSDITIRRYILFCPFFSPHIFSLLINSLFLWAFLPKCLEKYGYWKVFLGSYFAMSFAITLYAYLLAQPGTRLLAPETFVAAVLGVAMRDEIWESTTTLVPGHWGLRIFDVPSYVLLFFYLFYNFISHLLMKAPYESAPMPYFLPLIAFLAAFAFSSLPFFKREPENN